MRERAEQAGDYMRTVRLLQDCHNLCQKAFTANTPKEAGMNLPYLQLKRLQACSEICESTARLLLKDGILVDELCEVTASICRQCADSCDKVGSGSMQRLAELCRETAHACLKESYRIKQAA